MPAILKAKIATWMDNNTADRFPTIVELLNLGEVNQTLRVVDALSKIQRGLFTQDKLQGWLNDLQKQGVSNDQLEIFKEVAKPGMSKDEIATSIAATYSYTVEINTAKKQSGYNNNSIPFTYQKVSENNYVIIDPSGTEIQDASSEIDAKNRVVKLNKELEEELETPTQHHSNLTVPGGTNYTENAIRTVGIVNSISAGGGYHDNEFNQSRGDMAGWFRSDELTSVDVNDRIERGEPMNVFEELAKSANQLKTRRILEIQSFFQKVRNEKDLTIKPYDFGHTIFVKDGNEYDNSPNTKINYKGVKGRKGKLTEQFPELSDLYFKDTRPDFSEEFATKAKLQEISALDFERSKSKEKFKNQFLQLLNKDNNWVTFFVKSIIQDSAKKGYEKVIFPSGNTASKVEGHTTLEEFKKQKEDRIAKLEEKKKSTNTELIYGVIGGLASQVPGTPTFRYENKFASKNEAEYFLKTNEIASKNNWAIVDLSSKIKEELLPIDTEINQLKQELKRVEGPEGFGALKPIYNFYENIVTNILRKQYGKENVKVVTDEHGNTWNELDIKEQRDQGTILYNLPKETPLAAKARILKKVNATKEGFISPFKYNELTALLAAYNKTQPSTALRMPKAASGNYYIKIVDEAMQLSSAINEKPLKELEDKLRTWAETNGIAIEAIEDLIQRFEGKYQKGALGIADFANLLIGIADGRSLDTLPEEIAHFAVRILKDKGDISVLRALDAVHLTPEYAEVLEEYKDVYKTEAQFREETLGKILAKEIVGQYTKPEIIRPETKGFFAYLNAIKEKFIKWAKTTFSKGAKARVELENFINPLAKSILANEALGNLNRESKDVFYQLEEEAEEEVFEEEPEELNVDPVIAQKQKFLLEAKAQLVERMALLERGIKNQSTIDRLKVEIDSLEYKITKGELDAAIASFVKLAQGELSQIYNLLEKGIDNKKINPGVIVMSKGFMDMYSNLFTTFLADIYEWGIPKEERGELVDAIQSAGTLISAMHPMLHTLARREGIKTLIEANTDYNGNKIDPDFDEAKAFDDTEEDMSAYRLHVGMYKNASSILIKAATKIIFESISRIKRFTAQTANEVLRAQEAMLKSGGKMMDLVEHDVNGNPTQFFIREYNWSRYYNALATVKQEIAEALGEENYDGISKVYLNEADKKIYNAMWEAFYINHTKKLTTTEEIAGTNVIVHSVVPNDSYKNPKYAEMQNNPATKAYYDLLIQKKQEAIMKLPIQYRKERNVYMLPGVLKSSLDRLTKPGESVLTRVGKLARDSMFLDPDDTQFGQVSVLNNKMVPIFFTGSIKNTNDLSYDLARTVTLFAEMAENYQEMNKISGDLGVIQLSMAERNYTKAGVRKTGKEGTNEFKALEILMDTHVFGIERAANLSGKVPSNAVTEKLGLSGKQFSWTKANQLFTTFIRDNNLALGFTSAISNFLKGSGDSVIEDMVGLYTTNESKNWARVEFMSNIAQVSAEIGKAKQTNKMHLILQEAQVANIEKALQDTARNRATRKLTNKDLLYTPFATGDYGIKGRITLAIYDNYRLYNNQFMTRAKFYEKTAKESGVANDKAHQKTVGKTWEDLREKSLYNAYEVVNGNLEIKPEFKQHVTEGVLSSAQGKIDHVTHMVDGTLSETDKGALARTCLGDYLLMHRGWFFGMVDTRFRKEGKQFITEEEEIGSYRASADFMWNGIGKAIIKDRAGLAGAHANWKNLSPAKKRGVYRTGMDLLYLNIISILAAMANIAADEDDDDDWTTQYTAYQMNRLLLEQGAAWSPAELAQMIDEPVVGARMIKDLLDISEAWNFSEKYEAGMYKDDSHAGKWWFRKLPIKNLYEMQYPELKNNFIKQMVDSKVYQLMSPEQKINVGTLGTLKNWLIPTGLAKDYSSKGDDPVPEIIEELQDDKTVDNGFN